MPLLVHCIYASSATELFSHTDMDALIAQARAKNLRLGITGILLFMSGRFFQILEGKPGIVSDLYTEIGLDPRHTEVTQIIFETIHKRSFENWSMGLVDLSGDRLTQIITLNHSTSSIPELRHLPDGRARKLLHAFCEGRWGPTAFDLKRLALTPVAV